MPNPSASSNIFWPCSNIFDHAQKIWLCSKNIEHAQKNLNLVKIIFELADGTGSSYVWYHLRIFQQLPKQSWKVITIFESECFFN